MRSEMASAAYAAGEPLRAIAAKLGCTVDELCDSLAKQPTAELELERARFVRQRSLATNEVIYEDRDLLYRLNEAGIDWSDTPKVLKALGIEIDVEVAVELVNIPGVPSDRMETVLPARTLGDKLSLLYVAGKHHGIEPDYQLTLGTMPIGELAGLRSLMQPNVSPRRLAEFAAVAETTKLAIRAREVQTVSYSDYATMAEAISLRLGNFRVAPADKWPAPANVLLRRYGHGFWEDALRAAGLSLPSSESRFAEHDFFKALDDFTEECIDFEHPMSIAIYDRWIFSEASMRNDRPSALEIVRRYGSWASALEVMLPQEDDEDDDPEAITPNAGAVYLQPRFGRPVNDFEVLEEDIEPGLPVAPPSSVRPTFQTSQQSLGI
jgi:hypothetical protein